MIVMFDSSRIVPSPGSGIRLRTSHTSREVGASTTCHASGKPVMIPPGNVVIVLVDQARISSRPRESTKPCTRSCRAAYADVISSALKVPVRPPLLTGPSNPTRTQNENLF
jgi:hypothetical protein